MSEGTVILAVDDSFESLSLLVELLTPAGYQVRAADSGELGLAAVAVGPPDLILLGLHMKGMGGIEVCRRLKSVEETRDIPIILLSASMDAKERVAGLQLGASDFITEPFQPEALLARVRTHLSLHRASASLARQTAVFRDANLKLQAEVAERQRAEKDLGLSLEEAERARRALLGALEDQERAAKALRASEERLRDITSSVGDWVWEVNEDGVYTYSSEKSRDVLGRAPEEIVGKRPFDFMPPDEAARVGAVFTELVAAKAPIRDLEYWNLRKGGERVCMLTNAVPVLDAAGELRGYRGVDRDITGRKRAEQEREELQEQLRMSQRIEAVGKLAGGIAHDFNNLLSVILSYTGFALESLQQGDPLRNDLLEVKKSGERAATLTRQLLAFSRKQVLQPQLLSLNQVAVGIETMLSRILGEDVDLVQLLAPDLGLTLADPGQIEQALMNLVVNARDAMPDGGKLTIETSNIEIDAEYAARHISVKPGPYVLLAVTDTGCGMDPQTQARVFEPFFTTKEKGKGTGLGLSTVYGIVKQSGGSIWVYSEPGKGTTFKIYLPREAAGATVPAARPPAIPIRTGTETVLVVEDEEALRRVAARALAAAGYSVLSAADGEEALRAVAQHSGAIDLLVTDVVMPGMGGATLAQELTVRRPELKILYMSGYTDDAIVRHGVLEAGIHFLAKPFTAPDLTRKVREVLDGGFEPVVQGREPPPESGGGKAPGPHAESALPPEVAERLRKATIAARYDEVLALIDSIEATLPAFAGELRSLAKRFDFDALRAALDAEAEANHGG